MNDFIYNHFWLIPIIIIIAIAEITLKLIAMWKAARNQEKTWYICLALFNTLTILPLIYLIISKKQNASSNENS